MDSIFCTMCKTERHINNFRKKNSQCKDCNRARGLKRYYKNGDKVSNQQKIFYEIHIGKILLQKQNTRSKPIEQTV